MSLDHDHGRDSGDSRGRGAYSCTRPAAVTTSSSSPAAVMVSQRSPVTGQQSRANSKQAKKSDPTNPDSAAPGRHGEAREGDVHDEGTHSPGRGAREGGVGGFAAGGSRRVKKGWRDVPSQAGRFDRGRGELLLGHATRAGAQRSGGWGGDGCRMLRHDGVCWVLGVHV